METRRVRALRAMTEFVAGYGQVHFNPASSDDATRYPTMPVSVIERLVLQGAIADDTEGLTATEGEAPASPEAVLSQLDHDDDKHPGGDTAADKVLREEAGFVLTDLGGGYYAITGPEGFEPEQIRGKAKASPRFDELVAAAAQEAEPELEPAEEEPEQADAEEVAEEADAEPAEDEAPTS